MTKVAYYVIESQFKYIITHRFPAYLFHFLIKQPAEKNILSIFTYTNMVYILNTMLVLLTLKQRSLTILLLSTLIREKS